MPDASPNDIAATLDAWRAQGAERIDPVRFRFIEALARRAAGHDGEARRLLDEKLRNLIDAYRNDVEAAHPIDTASPQTNPRSPLAELIDTLAGTSPRHASYPDMPLLGEFKATWSKLSANRQLRQSFAQVPDNAGPLNSSHLVHQALLLMQDVSPGYLRQFLGYVEALGWMAQEAGEAVGKTGNRTESVKKGG